MLLKYSQFSFNGHLAEMDTQNLRPRLSLLFQLTLYKRDIWTRSAGRKGVRLRESTVITKTVKVLKALSPQSLNRPLMALGIVLQLFDKRAHNKIHIKEKRNLSYLESKVLEQASQSKG